MLLLLQRVGQLEDQTGQLLLLPLQGSHLPLQASTVLLQAGGLIGQALLFN